MPDHAKRLLAAALLFWGGIHSSSFANLALDLDFFPDLDKQSDALVRLHGLAELYPNTILFEDPKLLTRSLREEAAKIEMLPGNITYVRVYRLEEAISAIKEVADSPALILDMRYLQSMSTGMELAQILNTERNAASIIALGETTCTSTQSGVARETAGDRREHPAIVLCNRETAGPFEAILHSLQSNNCIIALGEPTAGRTGFYSAHDKQTWIIRGEIRPNAKTSLLNTGFVPRIKIDASPETNYVSYYLYESGTPITRLLRSEQHPPTSALASEELNSQSEESFKLDSVLQRAVDIVAALQILQELPVHP